MIYDLVSMTSRCGILVYNIWWYYMMIFIWWWDIMRTRWCYVILQTPMDEPVIEIAYGETMIHSTKAVVEILTWEEWLGCHHDTSLTVDIPESILVWAPYMIFLSFDDIKIYVLCFQIYMYYKMNIGGLWLRFSPAIFREGFWLPMSFKKKLIHRHSVFYCDLIHDGFMLICVYIYIFTVIL